MGAKALQNKEYKINVCKFDLNSELFKLQELFTIVYFTFSHNLGRLQFKLRKVFNQTTFIKKSTC